MADDQSYLAKPNSPFLGIISEHRRLAILRFLRQVPGYAANNRILYDFLNKLAIPTDREVLIADLRFMGNLGLVRCIDIYDLLAVELLETGLETADGRRRVEGVLEAGPGCPY